MAFVKNDLSIILSGEAGQGLKTLEVVFSNIVKSYGYSVFTYTEFMSRIRGGNNTTELRVSRKPCPAYVDRIDVVVPLLEAGLSRIRHRISKDTVIIGEERCIDTLFRSGGHRVEFVPLGEMAKEAGAAIMLNTVVCGLLIALMGIESAKGINVLGEQLKKGGPEKVKKNETAFTLGYEAGLKIAGRYPDLNTKDASTAQSSDLLMYGSDSIGIGALAGGCNFISSYPMSPATSVLEFLAKHSAGFGVVVEQAEDEIAAVNMAVGSWYAGGRAMVSTSGGGFALMEEGVSLAGAIESPLVVHLGQRPGPATGLPTRTEQADLNMALYSGHGEFSRVIFAPANFQDGVELTARAFSVADRFQVPVFVLTDQYFLDSGYTMPGIDIDKCREEHSIVETASDYRRYALTPTGVSPRGVPGFGRGIVCVDSDEHDEAGYITEDADVRIAMVDKRNMKMVQLVDEAIAPRWIGPEKCAHLIVGWGSTYHTLAEAIAVSGRDDVALLHFSQVYPVAPAATGMLNRAANRVIVENNATAQFGALLTQLTGATFQKKILKYNGMPFSVEELGAEIRNLGGAV
jgi:2-oxoglutarate/2-oxoacid ferredoxin oxidoreductase subunit alpha